MEYARARIERDYRRPLLSRVARDVVYRRLLPYPKRIATVARLLRFYQRSGLQSLARFTGVLKLFWINANGCFRVLMVIFSTTVWARHFRLPGQGAPGLHFLPAA